MRPNARRFAEQWLDEHAAETGGENVSVKDLADRLTAMGEARGIAAEDFGDDGGRLLEMILSAVDRSR